MSRSRVSRLLLAFSLTLPVLLALILVAPARASGTAHPAPSVIHDYLVQLGPGQARVYLRFAVSPQLVPQVYRKVDTNGDGVTQPAERQAWLAGYLAAMRFTVDDQPAAMSLVGASPVDQQNLVVSMQTPVTVTMAVTFTLPPDAPGAAPADHHFVLADGSEYVGYDEYYASFEDLPGAVTLSHDLTQPAGPAMFEAVFERDPSTVPAATPAPAAPAPGGLATGRGSDLYSASTGSFLTQLTTFLNDPGRDAGFGLLLFLLAVGLGGIHALTPGHGKALVAAYLVGSRGRVRDAVALGWIVTLTHTLSVIALGLVLLAVTNFVLPRWLQPALELVSGLIVVVLGLYLVATRVRRFRPAALRPARATGRLAYAPQAAAALAPVAGAEHSHAHATGAYGQSADPPHPHEHVHFHDHGHTHTHDAGPPHVHTHDAGPHHVHTHDAGAGHDHDHGPGGHQHVPPPGASPRDLLTLGISGGLVPCPEALAILFLTVTARQVGFGLLLVCSFSLGLAAVLIGLGILLVRARGLLERVLPGGPGGDPAWVRVLPLASALVVTVLGVALMLSALGQPWT